MSVLLVTLDTNQLDEDGIARLRSVLRCSHELACVTATTRERGEWGTQLSSIPETLVWDESHWGEAVWGGPIPEVWVLGESRLGEAVLADNDSVDVFETAVAIISARSFPAPGRRENLTKGERRQLRDAMIFEAHVRHRRHVLVTSDARGFISDGRREKLERLGRTRIVTPDELEEIATAGGLEGLIAPLAP